MQKKSSDYLDCLWQDLFKKYNNMNAWTEMNEYK